MSKNLKDVYTDSYQVLKGDSTLKIAMAYGVTVKELSMMNQLF